MPSEVPGGATEGEAALADAGTPTRPRRRVGATAWAALWCLPYLLLGVAWVFSNPPGAAPDELDHLIKAIGAGRLEIGQEYQGTGELPKEIRNDSISRVIAFPAKLDPYEYNCFARNPDVTADCLPVEVPGGDEIIERRTKVGAYPVMVYIPIGIPTLLAQTPDQAFYLARSAGLLLSVGLLFLGVRHLTQWLGRWAGTGLAIALTPMAVFTASSVSANGIEIMSAATVAALTVVAMRAPETLARPGTLAVLAVAGSALVLSRQLGIVTFSLLALIVLVTGGWRVVWRELVARNLALIATGAVLAASAGLLVWWELTYDNPVLTGPALAPGAFSAWAGYLDFYAESAIGLFGWLDSPMPDATLWAWGLLVAAVALAALLVGRWPDVAALALVALAVAVVAYVTYATVFFPIEANLQGRHLLSLFVVLPLLAVVALFELAARARRRSIGLRIAWVVAALVPLIQLIAIYCNARRYAVGVSGPWLFLDAARWEPPLGWAIWLAIAAVAAAALAVVLVRGGADRVDPATPAAEADQALPVSAGRPGGTSEATTNTQRR